MVERAELKGAPRVKLNDVKTTGDTLTIKFQATIFGQGGPQQVLFEYEGKLPKPGAKKIFGSLSQGGNMVPSIMEATTAKTTAEIIIECLIGVTSVSSVLTLNARRSPCWKSLSSGCYASLIALFLRAKTRSLEPLIYRQYSVQLVRDMQVLVRPGPGCARDGAIGWVST